MAGYDFVKPNGIIVADTSTTKAEVEAEQREIFGEDVDLSDESPNGVLVNAEVITRNGVAENNANLANQINPKLSGGFYLDSIWGLSKALTGGRKVETFSTFNTSPDVAGVPFTLIPLGSKALTVSGDEFKTIADVTLDGSGNGVVDFKAVVGGPIPAGIGDLSSLAPGAPVGWETVNNTVAATLGQVAEADEVSKQRRLNTLGLQGISVNIAVKSAILNLDNVKSLSYRENFTGSDDTIDGIFLLKNSVWACVDGGSSSEIAQALLDNKTCGGNWNGAITENVIDETTGQSYPVKLDRPDEIPIWIRVTLAESTVTDPEDTAVNSILKYKDGLMDGEEGFVNGSDVSPYEIASAVNIDTPKLFVKLIELSLDGITYGVAEIEIALDEVARTDDTKISVIII